MGDARCATARQKARYLEQIDDFRFDATMARVQQAVVLVLVLIWVVPNVRPQAAGPVLVPANATSQPPARPTFASTLAPALAPTSSSSTQLPTRITPVYSSTQADDPFKPTAGKNEETTTDYPYEERQDHKCRQVSFFIIAAVVVIVLFNSVCWLCFCFWYKNDVRIQTSITNSMQNLSSNELHPSHRSQTSKGLGNGEANAEGSASLPPLAGGQPAGSAQFALPLQVTEHRSSETNSQSSDIALTPLLTVRSEIENENAIDAAGAGTVRTAGSSSLEMSAHKLPIFSKAFDSSAVSSRAPDVMLKTLARAPLAEVRRSYKWQPLYTKLSDIGGLESTPAGAPREVGGPARLQSAANDSWRPRAMLPAPVSLRNLRAVASSGSAGSSTVTSMATTRTIKSTDTGGSALAGGVASKSKRKSKSRSAATRRSSLELGEPTAKSHQSRGAARRAADR